MLFIYLFVYLFIIYIQISAVLDKYKTYYLNKHSGRKLTWQHSLSFCTIKATFGDHSSAEVCFFLNSVILDLALNYIRTLIYSTVYLSILIIT